MIGSRYEIAWYQKDFYCRCYRKTLILVLIAIVIMLGLIGALIYEFLAQPHVKYYASTTNGQVIPMIIKRS